MALALWSRRQALDSRNLTATKIVVGDCGPGGGFQSPGLFDKLQPGTKPVDLSQIADVVGLHYPVSIMPVAEEPSGSPSAFYEQMWTLPQKFWASEEYSTYSDSNGGRCLAKLANRNYVDGNLTALIVWDMVWAWMDGLACSGQGLIWAGEPWSGAVGVVDTVWSIAHTTQVTEKGWRMLKKSGPWGSGGSGYLPPNTGWGPPPSPPPGQCLANASGFQCGGLQGHGYQSADACAALCCADPHCAMWQWAASGQSKGGSGCWLGTQLMSRSTCTEDSAWVGGERPPPQPLPPPTHCAAAAGFPANASNVQCAGLTSDSKAVSADTCAVNCCNDQSCAVWQFSNGTGGGVGGCWRGTCQQPPVDAKGWVGGQRFAPSPPPPPPSPAPAVGGSYVGYLSNAAEAAADFSLVIETMNNADSNCAYGNRGWGEVPAGVNNLSFCLSETVCEHHRMLFVTHSNMAVVGADAPRFVRLPPIHLPLPAGTTSTDSSTCCFDLSLSRNSVYSLSTRDTAKKGQLRPGTRSVHVSLNHARLPLSPSRTWPPAACADSIRTLHPQAVEGAARGCGTFPTPITETPFPLPYKTDFSPQYVRFQDFPEFLSDIQGIFRIRANPFSGTEEPSTVDSQLEPHRQQHSDGNRVEQPVLQQLTTEERAMTYGNGYGQLPMSLLGSKNWTDISVTVVGRVNGTAADSSGNETLAVYARCGHGFAFSAAGG